jgi:hypothetical protein
MSHRNSSPWFLSISRNFDNKARRNASGVDAAVASRRFAFVSCTEQMSTANMAVKQNALDAMTSREDTATASRCDARHGDRVRD